MLIGSKGTEPSRGRSLRRMLSQLGFLDAAVDVHSSTIVRSLKATFIGTLSISSDIILCWLANQTDNRLSKYELPYFEGCA